MLTVSNIVLTIYSFTLPSILIKQKEVTRTESGGGIRYINIRYRTLT